MGILSKYCFFTAGLHNIVFQVCTCYVFKAMEKQDESLRINTAISICKGIV